MTRFPRCFQAFRLVTFVNVLLLLFTSLDGRAEQKAAEQIIFGGDHAYPPFEWDDGGTPKGFNIELETEIAKNLGVEVKHRLANWPDTVRALETREVDVVPMFVSEERAKKFRFTPPFYQVHHAIYSNVGSDKVASLDDLAGRTLAVEELSYAHEQLVKSGVGARVFLVGNTLEALQAVVSGQAEYTILASTTASQLLRDNRMPLERVGPPLWSREYAFAIHITRPALAERLTEGLHEVIASGQYQQVFERWQHQLTPTSTDSRAVVKAVSIVLAPLLLVGGLGWVWSWSLRRTVAARTRELEQELILRTEAQERVRHLANYDVSTELPKLHHFLELANSVLLATHDVGEKEIAALRLNEMEGIVRTFGYTTGQHLITEFASRLKQLDLGACAYLGRGAFAILANRHVVRDRIKMLAIDLEIDGLSLSPQVTVGVAVWPLHSRDAEDLVRYAETALAVSTASKRTWTEYNPSMEPDRTDLQLVADFRRSAKRQLHAVYQPQVDLLSGEVVSAEALVRWVHPEFGAVSPSRFIHLLENAGLVSDLTDYMVHQAVRLAGSLRRQGTPCTISVNVTANDLLDGRLFDLIRELVARKALTPGDLKLELTETSVAENPEQIRRVLIELLRMGFSASIDDFGTGYSSLSYLSAFPVKEVKIDRGFVVDMLHNDRNRSIVRSTISMGHELGLVVVAEGAEDEATLSALRDIGCDRVQGFTVSKPLTERSFRNFLRRNRALVKEGPVAVQIH